MNARLAWKGKPTRQEMAGLRTRQLYQAGVFGFLHQRSTVMLSIMTQKMRE